jgi:integrase
MYVQRQLHPKSQIANRITNPKYEEERLVHLPEAAIAILKAQKKRQAEQRLEAGTEWHEDETSKDLVFRLPNGNPHGEKTILNAVHIVGQSLGVPDLHPHDLRHSFAIASLRAGIDVKTVQHNMGHKKASMTLDVYVAYTEEGGKEGAEKLSNYFSLG